MSAETVTVEEFLAEAAAVLQETQRNLQRLARKAVLNPGQTPGEAPAENRDSPDFTLALRLQQVSRQLSALSEQSELLSAYLQNGLQSPPIDQAYWPQIRIVQSQEEERTRLARAVESSVGQLLANAVFELASCRQLYESDRAAVSDGLEALQRELEQGLSEMRQFLTSLDPAAMFSNFGLTAGLRRYLEQFETRTGLETQLLIKTNPGRLPSLIELAIFRVIQEALENVYLHAEASQVDLVLAEKESWLEFRVIDNGNGVALDRLDGSRKSMGLVRMVDYAELLNGRLRVFSEPGRGTQVVLSIPYPAL